MQPELEETSGCLSKEPWAAEQTVVSLPSVGGHSGGLFGSLLQLLFFSTHLGSVGLFVTFPVGSFKPSVRFGQKLGMKVERSLYDLMVVRGVTRKLASSMFQYQKQHLPCDLAIGDVSGLWSLMNSMFGVYRTLEIPLGSVQNVKKLPFYSLGLDTLQRGNLVSVS